MTYSHKIKTIRETKHLSGAQRDGSSVKRTHHSCRDPGLSSHHPHGSLHPYVTSRIQCPLLAPISQGWQKVYIHNGKTVIYI